MYGRSMAHIEQIVKTYPIDGADNVEMAQVLDYHVVVKKGEFAPNDMVVYIEVDSIVPDGLPIEYRSDMGELVSQYLQTTRKQLDIRAELQQKIDAIAVHNIRPEFEFLRRRKFKIKAVNYSSLGVISQGILFSLDIVKPYIDDVSVLLAGFDCTELLGVEQIIEDPEDAGLTTSSTNGIIKFIDKKLLRYAWYRKWKTNRNKKTNWEIYFPTKSDEKNIQTMFTRIKNKYADSRWYVTEKLEGQNIAAVYTETKRFGLFKSKKFGVCSHHKYYPRYVKHNAHWSTIKRLGFEDKMTTIGKNLFIRGEHVGGKIQGNIYSFPTTDVYIFDVFDIDTQTLYPFDELVEFCSQYGFNMVPVISDDFKLPDTVTELLEYSNGYSVFGDKVLREGLVFRLVDNPKISFKVRSPKYLIKHDK